MTSIFNAVFVALCFLQVVLARNVANVLIYSYTAGFRHDSIPTGVAAMTQRGPEYGIQFTSTEDPSKFTDGYLSQFDALFFLSTTEAVLDSYGLAAFQRYLDLGGNFAAAHAATNCPPNFTSLELALGSTFAYHPEFTNATMMIIGPSHPSTADLPQRWAVADEVYNFVQNPRDIGAVVVIAADETSYVDTGDRSPSQGSPHPIAWYQEHNKGTNSTGLVGRSWYTGLGHSNASWQNDLFMSHVMGGITWVIESNTTRATNPDADVGSMGPTYGPPEPAPTTTVDIGPNDSASLGSAELKTLFLAAVLLLTTPWLL